jgi:hypothetical protein
LSGGRDDGAPGLRPQYPADYYGAFVLDPDGHRPRASKVALGVKQAGEIGEASRCHVVLRTEHLLHDG